jgi:hypothetical protein
LLCHSHAAIVPVDAATKGALTKSAFSMRVKKLAFSRCEVLVMYRGSSSAVSYERRVKGPSVER